MRERWHGTYTDLNDEGAEQRFSFTMDVDLNDNGEFVGEICEEEFYAVSKEMIAVKGHLFSNQILFESQYPFAFDLDEKLRIVIDRTQVGHRVHFAGFWSESQKMWSGTWEIREEIQMYGLEYYDQEYYGGSFELYRPSCSA